MSTVALNAQAKLVIASNVSRLLSERRMTQAQLAAAAGENEMAVSRIVRGIHVPNAAMLARIARALSVSTDSLMAITLNSHNAS